MLRVLPRGLRGARSCTVGVICGNPLPPPTLPHDGKPRYPRRLVGNREFAVPRRVIALQKKRAALAGEEWPWHVPPRGTYPRFPYKTKKRILKHFQRKEQIAKAMLTVDAKIDEYKRRKKADKPDVDTAGTLASEFYSRQVRQMKAGTGIWKGGAGDKTKKAPAGKPVLKKK